MSIEQIREARPVENSVHNVIQTLSVKLDSAARYGLYQEDAREDGFDDCVVSAALSLVLPRTAVADEVLAEVEAN
jgi:hypothetical protein